MDMVLVPHFFLINYHSVEDVVNIIMVLSNLVYFWYKFLGVAIWEPTLILGCRFF